jgi:S1-C subfamily serine protease
MVKVLAIFALSAILINYAIPTTTPEEILDTIVMVNGSSGVIVHSDDENTFILTDYHIIWDMVDKDGNYKGDERPRVSFVFVYKGKDKYHTSIIYYNCKEVYVDKLTDLAILRIDIGVKLNYSKISTQNLEVGEDIYIAANPNGNYRTIVRGIVSSKDRHLHNTPLIQISGGVMYGASGGGAFSTDGRLIGLARYIDLRNTGFCIDEFRGCYTEAIPYIGFFTPSEVIKDFLLSTEFKDKFDYLK